MLWSANASTCIDANDANTRRLNHDVTLHVLPFTCHAHASMHRNIAARQESTSYRARPLRTHGFEPGNAGEQRRENRTPAQALL